MKTKDWTGTQPGRDRCGRNERRSPRASLGCDGARVHLVALEADLSYDAVDRERYRGRAVLELGAVPGGYGWVFPKGDHVNVGVGGWETEGPRLRSHLGGARLGLRARRRLARERARLPAAAARRGRRADERPRPRRRRRRRARRPADRRRHVRGVPERAPRLANGRRLPPADAPTSSRRMPRRPCGRSVLSAWPPGAASVPSTASRASATPSRSTRRAWRVIAELLQDGGQARRHAGRRPDAAVSQRAPGRHGRWCGQAIPARSSASSASLTWSG